MHEPTEIMRFAAYVRDHGRHSRQWVADAASFTDAAILFAERAEIVGETVSIEVIDCETGDSRCFFIDLVKGDISSC